MRRGFGGWCGGFLLGRSRGGGGSGFFGGGRGRRGGGTLSVLLSTLLWASVASIKGGGSLIDNC